MQYCRPGAAECVFSAHAIGQTKATFSAGNDAGAKETVSGILKDFGWDVVDLGGIESSRYLEPMAMVWILHAFGTKTGNHAFKLLRK